jgi:Fic family protein
MAKYGYRIWHPKLYKADISVGQWRQSQEPMQIVSGAIGYEKVHYEAPSASSIDEKIGQFLTWYNKTNPMIGEEQQNGMTGPVRAAIAHLWFESIHPFEDGNGRVGRAIAEQALAQDLGRPPLLSLSTQIEKDRNAYYNGLNAASQATMDITPWVNWFSKAVLLAQKSAVHKVDFILKKAKFWDIHQHNALKARQSKVIHKLIDAGLEGYEFGVNAKKYMSMSGCSKATATRDLVELVKKECLYRLEGGGRNARYRIVL